MPTTLDNIDARDLPPAWKRQAGVKDDETVSVTITRTRQRARLGVHPTQKVRFSRAKIEAILARVDALPVLDDRSPEEIIGYDEFGLPT